MPTKGTTSHPSPAANPMQEAQFFTEVCQIDTELALQLARCRGVVSEGGGCLTKCNGAEKIERIAWRRLRRLRQATDGAALESPLVHLVSLFQSPDPRRQASLSQL